MTGAFLFLAAIDCVGSSVGLAELARHELRYDQDTGRTLGLTALWLLVAGLGFRILSQVA